MLRVFNATYCIECPLHGAPLRHVVTCSSGAMKMFAVPCRDSACGLSAGDLGWRVQTDRSRDGGERAILQGGVAGYRNRLNGFSWKAFAFAQLLQVTRSFERFAQCLHSRH